MKDNEAPGLFSYTMCFTCKIDGKEFEFHKDFSAPFQLREGDLVYVDGCEAVEVAEVVWYLDNIGHAYIELKDCICSGPIADWLCILDTMDYSLPDLAETPL